MVLSLDEHQDIQELQDYLKYQEEQRKEFLKNYMYILSTGMGDGITESYSGSGTTLNEAGFSEIWNFMKGRKSVKSYYDGLTNAAKSYIADSKKLDKLRDGGGEDIAKKREQILKHYEGTLKKLEAIKKQIDELKPDSQMLTTFDKLAGMKYKIMLSATGKKAGVTVAKLKGYAENIDALKKDKFNTENEWKEEEKKAGEAKKLKKQIDENPKTKELQGKIDDNNSKKSKLKDELDSLDKGDKEKKKELEDQIAGIDSEIKDAESGIKKELGEEDNTEETTTDAGATATSGEETGATATSGEEQKEETPKETPEEKADAAEKESKEAEEEVQKAKETKYKVDTVESKIKGAEASLDNAKGKVADEKDPDKKAALQKIVNAIKKEIDAKYDELDALTSSANESSIHTIDFFYRLNEIEAGIDKIILDIQNIC